MESPNKYSSHRCKNLPYLCETSNDPVSSKPVKGRERKFTEIRVYLFLWYRVCTKAMFILAPKQCLYQRKLWVWRVQNCIPLVGAKTSLTCAGLQTTPSQVSVYRAGNGNLRKSGSTFCHVTVFALKQCLYQKEATGVESPKMYSSRRSKNLTHLCGTTNDPSHVSQYRAETINLRKSGSTFYHGTVFAQKQYLYQK